LPERFDTAALRLQHAASNLIHAHLLPLQLRLSPATDAAMPSVTGPPRRGEGDPIGSRLARIVSLLRALFETGSGAAARSDPRMLRSSLVTNLLAFIFVSYVLCWNLTTVSVITMPERLLPVGPFLGLDQRWGMFAPSPSREDGWYVIPGNLRGGQQTDLMSVTRDDYGVHGVSWEKPQDVNAIFKNEHWRKYLENLYTEDNTDQRLYLGQYICRQWNTRHADSEQLTTFKITYMLETTLPNHQRTAPQKVVLWEHSCF
jgi:hypothetical protein